MKIKMKMAIKYLKIYAKSIIIFLNFLFIFCITLYLYQEPIELIFYALILCLAVGILMIIIDIISLIKKHNQLIGIKKQNNLNLEYLPVPKNLIEEDYQELIKKLYDEKIVLEKIILEQRKEMLDYYTLWVHQIKTPIAALKILLQSNDGVNYHEDNKEKLNELFKIEQYVEMVLGYLRLENITSDLLLNKYSLDKIIKQVLRKYASLFIGKKIKLNYNDLNTWVITDEKWITFVIEQIISNAIKYSFKKGTISIYMDKNKENTLVIEDNGIGIYNEDLPRVFDRGFTGFNGRSNRKSTGIGLYLCKSILIKLSHKITIESEIEKGTLVKIDLSTVNLLIE